MFILNYCMSYNTSSYKISNGETMISELSIPSD